MSFTRKGVASIHSRVEVVGAKPCPARPLPRNRNGAFNLSLAAQDSLSNLSAMHTLFSTPAPCAQDGEHAKKRRKTNHGTTVRAPQADIDAKPSVVLASISLDLDFVHPIQNDFASDAPLHAPKSITVSLEYLGRITDAMRILVLNKETGACVDVVATIKPDCLLSMSPHLQTAISLRTTGSSQSLSRAAFSRCILTPPSPGSSTYGLVVEIHWALGLSVVEDPSVVWSQMSSDLKLLSSYFHDADADTDAKWALSDFYDSVHVPPTDMEVSPCIQLGMTEASLYPFQQRAVDWLLRREGVAYSSTSLKPFVDSAPPPSFKKMTDALGTPCYVSQLRGMVVSNRNDARSGILESLQGGILAEEMGLGKTVELIALISHHKRMIPEGPIHDAYTGYDVTPSSATLIITPPTILEQWVSELHNHAPELKVFHYKGIPKRNASKEELTAATVDNLMRYDVVLTTYNVLAREIHFAAPPPDRSLRNAQRHTHRKSPLVEISWWRVCLDEAQMVENGVSQAATVARIIPRCNAWAVSGTPLRKDVQDLRGLLIFLRCDAFANNRALWNSQDKATFRGIFNQIALRHTKDKIRNELHLPPQRRAVITVSFTAIEEQNYNDMFRQMSDACWLTEEGQPKPGFLGWAHPTVIERMREWLVRLRQTCLHAHVGGKNKRALGGKNAPLRTVDEVLEVMMEQNDTNWKAEAREMILDRIKQGHVKAYAGDVKNRAETALPYYEEALQHTQMYLSMYRGELLLEQKKLGTTSSKYSSTYSGANEGLDEEDSNEDEDLGRIPVLRKSLRSFRELEHTCNFFIATTYHQMNEHQKQGSPESEEILRLEKLETEWYEKAKIVRRDLLKQPKTRAQQQMADISAKKPFYQVPTIDDLPDLGGIESRKFLDMMDKVGDFLNAQLQHIQAWREKVVGFLLMRLVDDDDDGLELTGEEYDESLKVQDQLYVYIMGLRTLVADRNTAINGLQDMLRDHELKFAVGQTREEDEAKRGHAPELVLEIAETRRKLLSILEGGSLKGVASGIRGLITTLQWRPDSDIRAVSELDIANKQLLQVQKIVTQQTKATAELEKELELFRSTTNQRLEYYRQFQHISDTVEKWKDDLDKTFDEREFQAHETSYERRKNAVAALKTKSAYLTHLREESLTESNPECIICQDQIQIGVLTACGHKYCKDCMNQWWQTHRSCPMCKKKLKSSEFRNISFKPSEINVLEETHGTTDIFQDSTSEPSNTSIYSNVSDSMMREIKMIDLDGSYGSKIDMIARHLLWIRTNDPGAKSIIFSQYGDFLEVLRAAFVKWKIGVSGITEKDGIHKFKESPAVECFLLDAKSDSSGLNLVNATYVFLCEPLINPAIELQAIARVHRIGQQRPTTVFMYLVGDTVEQAIYEISVARRLEHMKTAQPQKLSSGSASPVDAENTLDAANSAEMEAAPLKHLLTKKGDGEMVQSNDLWACLFSKTRRTSSLLDRPDSAINKYIRAEAAEGRRA